MKVLDEELDHHPTQAKVKQMAELRIQNLLCFSELEHFNNTGKWLNRHPLISHNSEREQLLALKRRDPQGFLKQYAACELNIRRYNSYVKSDSRKDKQKNDKILLKKHQDYALIFKSILENDQDH
jgi:hypothetical protein